MSGGKICVGLVASVLASAALATVPPAPTKASSRSARPNVLVILTDDQRATGTLRAMPALRRFFLRKGTYFDRAVVSTPLCCPSRASIFSGRYAHNHSVLRHTGRTEGRKLDQSTTLQSQLARAGYKTAYFGKYMNSWPLAGNPPYFDRFAIMRKGRKYHRAKMNVNGSLRRIKRYTTTYLTRRSLRFLASAEARDRRPWLLFIAPNAPHAPFTAARAHAHAPVGTAPTPRVVEVDRRDKPAFTRRNRVEPAKAAAVRAGQLRALMSVDDMIEDVMRKLTQLEESRNTIAIFLSDNGYLWGEHGLVGKMVPYTESVRVPLVLRWPGRVATGAVDHRTAANIDVAPTVLDAVGLEPAAPMDGDSLLRSWSRPEMLFEYWSVHRRPTWASLRTAGYQYTEYYEDYAGTAVKFREYYDLRSDPPQLENLLADGNSRNDPRRARLERLSDELRRLRACAGPTCP